MTTEIQSYERIISNLVMHQIENKPKEISKISVIDNRDVIEGLMLGDGSLTLSHRSINPLLQIRQKQKELVDYIKGFISPYAETKYSIVPPRIIEDRLLKESYTFTCRTPNSPLLLPYFDPD